jgi:hypothetical protein
MPRIDRRIRKSLKEPTLDAIDALLTGPANYSEAQRAEIAELLRDSPAHYHFWKQQWEALRKPHAH